MPVEQIAIEHLLQRLRAEYLEMPGLRLTLAQAARLWSLDRSTCAALFDVLLSTKFLTRTSDNSYVRADAGPSNGRRSGTGTPLGEPRTERTSYRTETSVPIGDARRQFVSATTPGRDRTSGR